MNPFNLVDDHVAPGSRVKGVAEFERVLSYWVNASDRPTVGAIDGFGGAALIRVDLERDSFVLNRDTPRPAVRHFLATAARAGGAEELRWHVIPNERGRINKVSYTDEGPPQGWFVYLRPDADSARLLT